MNRVTGEEWLVKKVGAYLPGAYEEVTDVVNATVLTEKVSFSKSQYFTSCCYNQTKGLGSVGMSFN